MFDHSQSKHLAESRELAGAEEYLSSQGFQCAHLNSRLQWHEAQIYRLFCTLAGF